ncbi:MAG: DUF1501 domain-containing protein [Candidatus Hydrogenedentes bacterium]|nr:DUF1501 domain-containing protein [Candidatus Hydrogenedentota bacterium]
MNPHHCHRHQIAIDRRDFLRKSAFGFGAAALGSLLARDATASSVNPLAPRGTHFPARADRVIFLFMTGGPSHMDTFDPKPALTKFDGQALPDSFNVDGLDLQFMKATDGKLMASPFPFTKHGQSGLEISSLFPNLARHADDLCVIRSCYHDSFIHGPALGLINCGSTLLGHPSCGAWVTYGLGCESDSLPAYIVMSDGAYRAGPAVAYGSGFLPAIYQGTTMRAEGTPISNLTPPIPADKQRVVLDALNTWNGRFQAQRPDDSRLAAQLANYELAYRMQTAAPDLIDLTNEPAHIKDMYGAEKDATKKFGRMCLLARRMAERGVRFIQLYNNDWDGHDSCAKNHEQNAARIDQPIAALIADLKQRGLLDTTLILWAGEFGRTPVMQGDKGRDHNPYGFTVWLAGGGVKGGQAIGATDDLGFRAVERKVHVHDLHATLLHALGFDHEKLTYHFEGRARSLTDVFGHVVSDVFA